MPEEIPRESEVIELFKKLVGTGPLPPHKVRRRNDAQ
jgi:hypothetical protein